MAQGVAAASGTFDIGGELTVNRLGFGSMQLTGPGVWGGPKDPDECGRVLRRAVELGVNLIDTADSYGPFVAEQLIRRALHPCGDDLLLQRSDAMLPIPGTSSVAHLEENTAAAGIELSDEDFESLAHAAA